MERIEVLKTYKLFIGGAFPRSESGRHFPIDNKKGELIANCCMSSRKDVKSAVVASQKVFGKWSEKTAFNRSQILYRIAEMLEGRKSQLIDELTLSGQSLKSATSEIEQSIDVLIYYAGWCDKYVQVSSSINPVSSPHFNFSVPEPVGVVGAIFGDETTFHIFVSVIASIISGGNTVIALPSKGCSMAAITFGEIIATSDVPGGVVNILTGNKDELQDVFSTHMGINSLTLLNTSNEYAKIVEEKSVSNLKRVSTFVSKDLKEASLSMLMNFQELKTTWHPIENIGGAASTY